MGMQTRSSASSSPVKSKAPKKVLLPGAEEEPYKIFVLPSNTTEDARFVLLKNPRDGARRRYYFCPQKGLFEVTKISAGAGDLRSILFAPSEDAPTFEAGKIDDELNAAKIEGGGGTSGKATDRKGEPPEGYVNKSAEIFVATPYDPIFILLLLLGPPDRGSTTQSGVRLFRPFDDILDEQLGDDRHLRDVMTNHHFRPTLLRDMNRICDSVEAGNEQMYRLSMSKLYECILTKAQRVVGSGLPASLEDRFVTRSLEVPMLSVKREENTVSIASEQNDAGCDFLIPDVSESQSSAASIATSLATSEVSSATSIGVCDNTPSTGLIYLQRLRTAISFITASYLDPTLVKKLEETSRDSKLSPDLGPLDEHLQQLANLRAEALVTRSLSDFSKKRTLEGDEAAEERAEKKRRQEEEDKKKKSQESRGVRDLKKVNVTGMKKMNDFFAKKAPNAKAKS